MVYTPWQMKNTLLLALLTACSPAMPQPETMMMPGPITPAPTRCTVSTTPAENAFVDISDAEVAQTLDPVQFPNPPYRA